MNFQPREYPAILGGARIALEDAPFERGRVECGNPGCSKNLLAFLKDRRRPVFEGRWGCTARCLESLTEAAVRRDAGEGDAREENLAHHHRMPLGLILLEQGWITHVQLQYALSLQRCAGTGRIGYWLTRECGLEPARVTRALGMQWRCPVLSTEGFDPGSMALAMPRLLMERTGLVPLRIAGSRLYVGFEDRLDAAAVLAMERMSGLRVQSGIVAESQWREVRSRLSDCAPVEVLVETVADVEALSKSMAATLGRLQPRASRLVRVHELYWLRLWLETGAMSTREGGMPPAREDVADRVYTLAREQ
jgi:hypothetical protein